MNLQKQRSTLLRAARWLEEHPDKWGTGQFVKSSYYGDGQVKLCAMAACAPKTLRREVYLGNVDNDGVGYWVNRNFPQEVVTKVSDLNDASETPEQAARRIRSFVGRRYS
jgi:hypothetical protein